MKIKIINLLNKIANGEEVPKKIKVEGLKFEYDECMNTYFKFSEEYGVFSLIENWLNNSTKLNDEVEIIEEDKTIEELKPVKENEFTERYPNNRELTNKINELVKEINKMKEELNGKNN